MSKKTKIIIGIAVVLGLGAILAFSLGGRDRNLPKVTTAKVEKVDLVAKVTANGKIQARRKVDLSALVMGQIVNLAVQEGDHVKKGQLLLQIDKAQLAAAAQGSEASLAAMQHDLDAARANAEQAKFDYERAKGNFDAHILAEADYQKAKSTLDAADATLAATEQRMHQAMATLAGSRDSLSKTTVTSPHRRRGDRASRQGGRGHRHRHDEQPGHAAPDDLGHGRGRGGDDGRRDLRAAGQARADREPLDRRLSRARRSRASSPRSAPRRSRRTIRICSRWCKAPRRSTSR